ncbi:MAG TPA: glycosyltransferase [Terracidiphilus sp.]|jgi:glycosyltransferase involved in cell wall biosynthesis
MHIAFLIPSLDRIGGAEQQLTLLAKGLAHRGWRVSIIVLSGSGGRACIELRSDNVVCLSLHMRKGLADPRGWIQLHRWIRCNRPDVVHAHLPHAVLMARWSRFLAPVRALVETIHSPAVGGPIRRFAYRISAEQPDVVTAVSRTAGAPWLIERMVHEGQLAILPNGIDMDHWKRQPEVRRAIRQSLGLGDEFVWLAVGRLHPVKDHTTLLRAFARVPVSTGLLIVGSGPLESELRRLAGNLGIESRVQFLGFQSNVLPWIQAADAFVLTSLWEGLPMAFLESAACELPAIYIDIPAMRELNRDQPNPCAIPVGDSNALGAAMSAMMRRTEQERYALGRHMRQSVADQFNLPSVLDHWEETYRALLALKPCPTRSGSTPVISLWQQPPTPVA